MDVIVFAIGAAGAFCALWVWVVVRLRDNRAGRS
jgi:hypothetical protein